LNLLNTNFRKNVIAVILASLFSVSTAFQASADGITWISRTAAASNTWSSIAYGNGIFVAVSHDGNVMTSPDGITWTSRSAAAATIGGQLHLAMVCLLPLVMTEAPIK